MDYQTISARIAETGMICRGGFHPGADDGLPGATGTAIMVGNAGAEFWRRFRAEFPDGTEDPLNVWSGSKLGSSPSGSPVMRARILAPAWPGGWSWSFPAPRLGTR